MHKPKPPRRSRLIRKWDGTPVVESEATTESPATNIARSTQSVVDQPETPGDLAFEFEREDELSGTFER